MTFILSFLKPYKVQIYIAYIFTFIELVAELLFPLFLGIVINKGIIADDIHALYFWGSMMLLTTILAFIAGIINSYYSAHISVSAGYNIRKELFITIQRLSFNVLSLYPAAMIVTRFTNDVRIIQNTIFMALRIMIKAPFIVIGSVIMSFIINFKISLIFVVIIPILIIFLYWVLQKGSTMFREVQEHVDHVNQIIQENIAGMRIIKAFVRRDFEATRFTTANHSLAHKTRSSFRFVEASMPILLFVMNLSLLFILWFGHKQSMQGTASVGDVVAIINYALRTIMMISMFTFIALAFSRAKASGDRIYSILNEKAIESTMGTNQHCIDKGTITFQNVSFSYPNSQNLTLSNITFTIKQGETLAIMGETGSGKTTMFQLIPNLYEPTSGQILLDEVPIKEYDIRTLRNHIGYVAQNSLLFSGTISENIRFGKEDATLKEIMDAAKTAQIHESIMAFPNGYDTIIGQKGVNLSGGQKQRISIARAIIRKPKILLLDDSTSALDVETETKFLNEIDINNCSTFIITQKVKTAQRADRILLLDKGKLLHIGSHEDLIHSSTLYQEIVASQFQKEYEHA